MLPTIADTTKISGIIQGLALPEWHRSPSKRKEKPRGAYPSHHSPFPATVPRTTKPPDRATAATSAPGPSSGAQQHRPSAPPKSANPPTPARPALQETDCPG